MWKYCGYEFELGFEPADWDTGQYWDSWYCEQATLVDAQLAEECFGIPLPSPDEVWRRHQDDIVKEYKEYHLDTPDRCRWDD
jgi:hypothetical protein